MEQIGERFEEFASTSQLDLATRMVLRNLVRKYIQGDKDALFGKMAQLENDNLLSLCASFKKCLDQIGLNDEFLNWKDIDQFS